MYSSDAQTTIQATLPSLIVLLRVQRSILRRISNSIYVCFVCVTAGLGAV
jgi:hypothetical protein